MKSCFSLFFCIKIYMVNSFQKMTFFFSLTGSPFWTIFTGFKAQKIPSLNITRWQPEISDENVHHSKVDTWHDFSFLQTKRKPSFKDYEKNIMIFSSPGPICPKMIITIGFKKLLLNQQRYHLPGDWLGQPSFSHAKKHAMTPEMEFSHWDKRNSRPCNRKPGWVVKLEKPDELYDMVHTENFIPRYQKVIDSAFA
jgi:protein SCO1/2